MLISIVVPAYNEEKLLPDFLKNLNSYLRKSCLSYEILVIENGSSDKTLEIAKSFTRKNKKIKVSHLSKPSYGQALIRGFNKARGDDIILFNVDFWDKRFIDLVKVNLLGYDIVTASKNLPGSRDRRPLARRLVSKSLNFFLRFFLGYSGTDTHGIKIFSRKKGLAILRKCRTKTGLFDSEFLVRSQRAGLKILELPVEIKEVRPNRFGVKRVFRTPADIVRLFWTLNLD